MNSSTSWSALLQGRRLAYTVLLTLSIGIHAVGLHMLATVLPSIVADLGGAAFYAWATLLYTIASIIGTVCGGLVAARGWWRGAFWVTTPVLLPLSILAWYTLPPGESQRTAGPVPLLRLTLLGLGVLSVAASGQVTSLVLRLALISSAVVLVG